MISVTEHERNDANTKIMDKEENNMNIEMTIGT